VKALAAHYSPLLKREIDPMTEIVTTIGATEGKLYMFIAYIISIIYNFPSVVEPWGRSHLD
jgi:hypothetical protein